MAKQAENKKQMDMLKQLTYNPPPRDEPTQKITVLVDGVAEEASEKHDDTDMEKFTVITRASTVNSVEFGPFIVSVGMNDHMLVVRRKVFEFCHSSDLIGWDDDKMRTITLNVIDGNKKTGKLIESDNNMMASMWIMKGGSERPINLVMTFTKEMVGGGKRATTLMCFNTC